MNYFDTRYTYDRKRKGVWKAICEYLQIFIPKDSVVLDFGAGYCDFINQIKASKKIAIDLNSESKKYCNKDISFYNSLDSMIGSPIKIDVIFMSNILEHLDDNQLDDLFKNILKVIKSNGKIILVQPNYFYSYRQYWDDYTHKKAFSHISLADFLNSKGFDIIRVEGRFLPLTMKSIIPKSYLLTKLFLASPFRPFSGQMLVVAKCK
jgi:SAM-dependent methyltransferase